MTTARIAIAVRRRSTLAVALPFALALVCGCSQNGTNTGSGGSGGQTGPQASGGRTGTGGATSTEASGGSIGAGGSGGATSTGGLQSGGNPGTGGAAAAGGSPFRDGATPTEDAAAAGASGTGGVASGGGSPIDSGGGTSVGGALSTGGGTAPGGTTGTGGTSAKPCGTTAATLREAAECSGRLIGAALSSQHISESGYANAAKEHNYVTPENEMKWDQIEPTRNQYSWNAADQIVSFAKTNGMKVKGHTLVWFHQLPQWVKNLTSAADVRSVMLSHIKGVMQHYRGKVAAWDVVNEAVSIEGTSYRDNPFYKYLGEGYIDEAFKAAREADPDAKLYYNDYNAEGLTPKSDFVYELVKGLKTRGVPIDGLGMQMHYGKPNGTFSVADFSANLRRIIDLDLDVVLSEMDIHVCDGLSLTQQANLYHDLVAACVAEQRCTAVTFWGITDKYSWLNDYDVGCSGGEKPVGLLWDDNFKKKATYTSVLNALLGL